jgi:hypothetical protein
LGAEHKLREVLKYKTRFTGEITLYFIFVHALNVNVVPGISRGQSGRGVVLTTHPHLSAEVMKG